MWRYNKVLVIDDNEPRRQQLQVILDFLGEEAVTTTFDQYQDVLRGGPGEQNHLAVVVGDCAFGQRGLQPLLKSLHTWNDELPVILVGDQPIASDGLAQEQQAAVIASLSMPFAYNTLLDTLHRARLYRESRIASKHQPLRRPVNLFRSLVGASRQIQVVRGLISQLGDTETEVLITGKPGTGKEVVARNLHYNSPRRKGPFVSVNCSVLRDNFFEKELFGYDKDAFSGAVGDCPGRFEAAEGGTLFLDEIGGLSLAMQDKLLRVLQEQRCTRLGSATARAINVRVIVASQRDLERMVAEGRFRKTLFNRLNRFTIKLPSLKERAEDIPLLINGLVARLESEQRGSVRFNSAAIMSLCRHDWYGNTRELANLVEHMAIMHPCGVIGVQDLPPGYRHIEVDESESSIVPGAIGGDLMAYVGLEDKPLLPEQGIDLREYMANLERELIRQALRDCGGVVARAADKLCIRRTTLVEKMRKYDLQR